MGPRLSLPNLTRMAVAAATVSLLGAVIGCGSAKAAPANTTVKDGGRLYDIPKTVPANLEQGRLKLLHQGHALYVGDDQSRLFEVFGPPAGASDVSDLPDGWDKDHYRVKGWEKGKDAFGAILVKDDVALAMFTTEGKSALELESILNDYEDEFGKPGTVLDHGDISYRFWSTRSQRLMVAAIRVAGEGYRITQALGTMEIMDPLHMSENAAKSDVLKAENLAKPTP